MYEIRKLNKEVINAIAAGEVIERPYSIVKELIENSIDAGAKNIEVHIDFENSINIKIVDDGAGIDEKYLGVSVDRHATSKLLNSNLYGVTTLGFRGEALYAIAAASKLTIISRTSNMSEAKKLIIKNNLKSEIIPTKGKLGTEVIVEEIFNNIPVRRKFMKSKTSEFNVIRSTIKKIAFSRPHICINYYENRKIKYLFTAGKKEKIIANRISEVLGDDFLQSSLYVKEVNKDFSIKGFIGIPTYNKPTWNDSIIVLNNRVIKDRVILGAIKAAYAGLISGIRFPVVSLFFDINPDNVDFNVHPTKSEVRILNRNIINAVLIKRIRYALKKAGLVNSVSFERNLINSFNSKSNIKETLDINFENTLNTFNKNYQYNDIRLESNKIEKRLGYAIAQINKMFIIAQSESKLILIDQHAAHERIVLEKIRNSFLKGKNIRQVLLIPETIKILEDKNILFKNEKEINRLGIIFEDYGEESILVREIPSILGKINIQHLFDDLLINLKDLGNINAKNSNIEKIFSSISCHNSIRAGRSLNIEEMNSLLRLMEETPNAGQCNHGRPTFIELSLNDIERLFGRV